MLITPEVETVTLKNKNIELSELYSVWRFEMLQIVGIWVTDMFRKFLND